MPEADPLEAVEAEHADDSGAVDELADSGHGRLNGIAHTIGDGLGRLGALPVWLGISLVVLAAQFWSVATRAIPRGQKFWASVAEFATYRHQKSHSGELSAFAHTPDGIELGSLKWVEFDHEDEQKEGWCHIETGHVYHDESPGQDIERFGKAHVKMFDTDDVKVASRVEADFAEAADLGRGRPVFRNATLNVIQQFPSASAADETLQEAAQTDGGMVQREGWTEHVQVGDWGAYEDYVVPLGSPAGFDGKTISARKVKETYQEKTGSDIEKQAEVRGKMAGMAGQDLDKGKVALTMLIIAIVGALLLGYGDTILRGLFGGGSLTGSLPGLTIDMARMMVVG